MPKLFITLRKKLILPLKWWKEEKRIENGAYIPTGKDLLELKKMLDNKKILLLRKGLSKDALQLESGIKLLDALLSNTLEDYKKTL